MTSWEGVPQRDGMHVDVRIIVAVKGCEIPLATLGNGTTVVRFDACDRWVMSSATGSPHVPQSVRRGS
jgi:hypothetical protein